MLVFIFGFVGAAIGGIFIDKFKRFKTLRIVRNNLLLIRLADSETLFVSEIFVLQKRTLDRVVSMSVNLWPIYFELGKSLVWYVFSLLSLSAFVYVGTFGIFWLDAIVAALIGFFMIGIVPIFFNFGGELVYPESEATGSALLTCSANLIGQNHLLFD